MNHKRIERIYREEGLAYRRKKTKKHPWGKHSQHLCKFTAPNQEWALDFISGSMSTCRKYRILNVIDEYTRESLAMEIDTSLSGKRVVFVLNRICEERGLPKRIRMDNGTEFTSKAMKKWFGDINTRVSIPRLANFFRLCMRHFMLRTRSRRRRGLSMKLELLGLSYELWYFHGHWYGKWGKVISKLPAGDMVGSYQCKGFAAMVAGPSLCLNRPAGRVDLEFNGLVFTGTVIRHSPFFSFSTSPLDSILIIRHKPETRWSLLKQYGYNFSRGI